MSVSDCPRTPNKRSNDSDCPSAPTKRPCSREVDTRGEPPASPAIPLPPMPDFVNVMEPAEPAEPVAPRLPRRIAHARRRNNTVRRPPQLVFPEDSGEEEMGERTYFDIFGEKNMAAHAA